MMLPDCIGCLRLRPAKQLYLVNFQIVLVGKLLLQIGLYFLFTIFISNRGAVGVI
jgi:hypothetical protein